MYIYTRHALQKIDSFGIEKEEIDAVVKKGVKWKDGKRDIWHANMGNLEVVFTKNNGGIVIL